MELYEKGIVYAIVDERQKQVTMIDGLTCFPTEEALRKFRLANQNVIWLEELPDKDCTACYGTGREGTRITPLKLTEKEITKYLAEGLENEDSEIYLELGKALDLDYKMIPILELLTKAMFKELTNNNASKLAEKYAKIVVEDFTPREVMYCQECFLPNLEEKVSFIKRMQKFAVN